MDSLALNGRSILIVEEEADVALHLESHFRHLGAKVYGADNLRDALHMAHHPSLSAAVVNLQLGSDSTSAVCRRLTISASPSSSTRAITLLRRLVRGQMRQW